jgi:hypothetical protein
LCPLALWLETPMTKIASLLAATQTVIDNAVDNVGRDEDFTVLLKEANSFDLPTDDERKQMVPLFETQPVNLSEIVTQYPDSLAPVSALRFVLAANRIKLNLTGELARPHWDEFVNRYEDFILRPNA